MLLYVHVDQGVGSSYMPHTERMTFDAAKGDIPFAMVRAMFVDAYNAKHVGHSSLDVASWSMVDQDGYIFYHLNTSIFADLNDGDDIFLTANPSISSIPAPSKPVRAAPANAIEASQARAGESSYYYAHEPRLKRVINAPTSLKQPQPATATDMSHIEKMKPIASYSMIDDPKWVKVLISEQNIPGVVLASLPPNAIRCEFRERSFDLIIAATASFTDGASHYARLHVPVLAETIDANRCRLRVKVERAQVVVSLRKQKTDYSWHELRKIKGVGETGTIEHDYGETFVKNL